MDDVLDYKAVMEKLVCPVCGCIYAIPAKMLSARRESGETWYCPNGHSLHFSETAIDRLQKKLQEATIRIDEVNQERWQAQKALREARKQLQKPKKKKQKGQ